MSNTAKWGLGVLVTESVGCFTIVVSRLSVVVEGADLSEEGRLLQELATEAQL